MSAAPRVSRGRARAPLVGAALLVALLLAAGCGSEPVAERAPEPPPGAWLAGDSAALVRVLRGLEALAGTPAAREAATLRSRLEGCGHFTAHAPSGAWSELPDHVICSEPQALPPALRRLRGDAALVFAGPLPGGARAAGTLRVDAAGSVHSSARLQGLEAEGPAGLLVPAEAPPGAGVLAGEGALVHARVRAANGLDVASLVPSGSQGDTLFALKSELFAGAVLDGTWELALYMPEHDARMPPAALAVGVHVERAAVAALERFVEDVQSRWPVSRTPFSVQGFEGACIPDLELLPELGPCYVLADGALVLGWNPRSVRRALAGGAPRPEDAPSGIDLRLARLERADRRLRQVIAPQSPPPRIGYAWERLRLRGERGPKGALQLRAELLASGTDGASAPPPASRAGEGS